MKGLAGLLITAVALAAGTIQMDVSLTSTATAAAAILAISFLVAVAGMAIMSFAPAEPKARPSRTRTNAYLPPGRKSELDAAQALCRLPSTHQVLLNVLIPSPQSAVGSVEADIVVVGPAGLFLFESKAHRGTVVIELDSPQWNVHSAKGTTVLRNPIRQLDTQRRALNSYLRRLGVIPPPIHIAVFMPNASVIRPVNRRVSVPIFQRPEFLAAFVQARNEMMVSDPRVREIVGDLRTNGSKVPSR